MTLDTSARSVPAPDSSARRICVFCGSHLGARPEYAEAARAFGSLLARQGLGLVYGGTSIGLMGEVAGAALAGGSEVIGVLPGSLAEKEIAHRGLSKLHVVDSLAERKQLMFDLSNGFVTLPGGTGTLDELSEMLTWAQLGFHSKPLGLLNVAGFFDPLLEWLRLATAEGMVREKHLALLLVEREPAALVEALLPRLPAAAGGR
ncbi:MAG TPA: TIGR00730 family Rossman fold protein [bacterium]|nr:TIGR00730 family Rossman fold protein [bacterium]